MAVTWMGNRTEAAQTVSVRLSAPSFGASPGAGGRLHVDLGVEDALLAVQRAGVAVRPAPADATTRGQWRVALAAGLVKEDA